MYGRTENGDLKTYKVPSVVSYCYIRTPYALNIAKHLKKLYIALHFFKLYFKDVDNKSVDTLFKELKSKYENKDSLIEYTLTTVSGFNIRHCYGDPKTFYKLSSKSNYVFQNVKNILKDIPGMLRKASIIKKKLEFLPKIDSLVMENTFKDVEFY